MRYPATRHNPGSTPCSIFAGTAFFRPKPPRCCALPALRVRTAGAKRCLPWPLSFPQEAAGHPFCFTKATQGTTITDSTFVNNMNRGRAAGILMGCYHFADPTVNTATAEANYFVSVARSYISAGYLRPVLDLERGDTLGRTALSQWANTWMNAVQQQTGVEPILYCNPNYATNYLDSTLANRNVWIAHYLTNPDPQNGSPSTGIFPTWNFWQYTANGTLPGLSGSKDLDVFNGTAADLQAFVIGGAP